MNEQTLTAKNMKKIKNIQSKLRLLKDWEIFYQQPNRYAAQCTFHPRKKRATIYGWGNKTKEPKDFLIHELLHCALRELTRMDKRKPKELRQAEEILVQDICKLIYRHLFNDLI